MADNSEMFLVIGVDDKTEAGFKSAGKHAKEFGEEVKSLEDKLKEFVREERGEGRMGSFIANELQKIPGLSREAGSALGTLAVAFAGGSALGLGIKAAEVGIELISGAFREAGKEAEELNKKRMENIEGALKSLEARAKAAGDELKRAQGIDPAEAEGWADYGKVISDVRRQQEELLKGKELTIAAMMRQEEGAKAYTRAEAEQLVLTDKEREKWKALEDEIARAKKLKDEYTETHGEAKETEGANKEAEKAKQEAARRAEAGAKEVQAIRQRVEAEGLSELGKMDLQAQKDIAKLEEIGTEEAEEAKALVIKKWKEDTDAYIRRQNQESAKQFVSDFDKGLKEGVEAAKKKWDELFEHEKLLAEQADEREKTHLKTMQNVAQSVANVWSSTFQSIVLDSKNAEKAILMALISSAKIAVMAYAAEAAAIAAKEHMKLGPIVGIIAATAAAGTAFALVEGFIAKIPSAAGGMYVPAGVNPLTQIHEEEVVLPKDIAAPFVEAGKKGGGLGGGVTVVVQGVIDGDHLLRVVQSPQFGRAWKEAQRNGYVP